MRPRFGFLTRSLAVVFILAGLGAAFAALSSGHQSTPGHGYDDATLFLLAIGFLVVGAGLGLGYLWAWWSGAVITCFTVVMDLVLRSPDRGWGLWLAFLAVFAVTGVQGWRDRSPG